MTALAFALTVLLAFAPQESAVPDVDPRPQAEQLFAAGVEAWLAGRADRAVDAWRAALDESPPPALAAATLYNLGNAAWHADRPLEAVGWYTAALPFAPRDADLLDNLDLARSAAELGPRDRGDLASAVELYLGSWTEAEARWMALLGLLPLLVALIGEALRGGAGWRMCALVTLLLAAVAAAPLVEHERRAARDEGLVLASAGTRLLPEPAGAAGANGTGVHVDAGERVLRLDELPGWVRVETALGDRGWLAREHFFPLRR